MLPLAFWRKSGFRHMGARTDPTDGPIWRWEKQVETA
jgi:hypothetical protein